MIPYYGNYQGLYINSEVFEANGIAPVTDWNSFLAAIEKLKAAGVTPIAAGFKDRGLEYLIDELVLCEGGASEHSFVPKNGILSSWDRALADIKDLEAKGAFTSDCYNVSFEEAKQDFFNGEAAMIVAPSADIVKADNKEGIQAVAFPTTPNGKREQGDFIGDAKIGAFISAKYFKQVEERYGKMVIELLGADYGTSADFVSLLIGDATGFSVNKSYYNMIDSSLLGSSYSDLLDMAYGGDRPMRTYIKTMDSTVNAFRKALTGQDKDKVLQAAVQAEVAALAEAK
jgi:ABC-type glycerol-3-phosphate transport system substrate-binding protein